MFGREVFVVVSPHQDRKKQLSAWPLLEVGSVLSKHIFILHICYETVHRFLLEGTEWFEDGQIFLSMWIFRTLKALELPSQKDNINLT